MAGALALPVVAWAAPSRRVKTLDWTGTAHVKAGDKTLSIDVKTHVEPYVRARSETRLTGTSDLRTLIIEPNGGWVERGGARTPLPAAQVEHERQQYAIYGYLADVILAKADIAAKGDTSVLEIRHESDPWFRFKAREGDTFVANYTVNAPDGSDLIDEVITCRDWRIGGALPWPYDIQLQQRPQKTRELSFFALKIDAFTAELA